MSYVLAIDVGTSFTAAALVRPDQGPTPAPGILPLGLHGSAVPSVLFYAEDGRVLVGEAAERRGLDDPQRMVREFKRRIGDSVPLAVGESWLAPEDVYATMARWVVDRAEEREGSSPSSIIMTHPAAWGQHRTSLVLAALQVAGLEDITLISEPEAAALHYASQTRVEDGSVVAVYDLGGGTFDTAILRKASAGNFELLGRPDGIETLGGADFDAAVLRHVMGHLGEGAALDVSSPETLAALSRLRRECREAKEALSLDSEASVAVSLPGSQLSVRLVRSEFEAMIEAPVRDTVDALERSLRSINLEAQDLSAVLLIGGSSRIPLVAELISVELDRPIAVDADPKSSICLGAAVAGLRSSGAGAVDAATAASSASVTASGSEEPVAIALGRPHLPNRAPALGRLKAASDKSGRHAPRPRVRMAAAAAVAATALTIATATAAQSPEGTGLLTTVFGNQAADVMRDTGAQASGAKASGAGGATASAPVVGGPAAGLEASVKTGVTRAGSKGTAPAKQGANAGATNAGTGSAANGSGSTAGTGSGGTSSDTAAGGTGGTTTPTAPGTGTSTPGTQTPPPATTPPTTPAPDPTGGAASGPTPPPTTTTPPPVTTDPTTPPANEPTTPPTTPVDPVTPPPSPSPEPEPTAPQPEPTAVQDPPASPEPIVSQETTPPAVPDPAPSPTETSPSPDPALLSAV
ncbi:Hsp70 family protein [Paenarthrobacter sp.]|uniref:Hsp70 family protein n=1 Tax=Paenarthrobacter sp. TaxID=1931993 RepID=UPI00281215E3|nr:Hsp70 family protein [Paenarthrobacter sp.]